MIHVVYLHKMTIEYALFSLQYTIIFYAFILFYVTIYNACMCMSCLFWCQCTKIDSRSQLQLKIKGTSDPVPTLKYMLYENTSHILTHTHAFHIRVNAIHLLFKDHFHKNITLEMIEKLNNIHVHVLYLKHILMFLFSLSYPVMLLFFVCFQGQNVFDIVLIFFSISSVNLLIKMFL